MRRQPGGGGRGGSYSVFYQSQQPWGKQTKQAEASTSPPLFLQGLQYAQGGEAHIPTNTASPLCGISAELSPRKQISRFSRPCRWPLSPFRVSSLKRGHSFSFPSKAFPLNRVPPPPFPKPRKPAAEPYTACRQGPGKRDAPGLCRAGRGVLGARPASTHLKRQQRQAPPGLHC